VATHFERLRQSAVSARKDAVLIAPFVKSSVIGALIDALAPTVSLCVVTRWRVDEILAGASDVSVLDLLSARAQSAASTRFLLLDEVHAKYYRFDDDVLVGSANLTQTGLGITGKAVELLLEVPRSCMLNQFESQAIAGAYEPTCEQVEMYRALVPDLALVTPMPSPGTHGLFVPRFRNPADAWAAYVGRDYPPSIRRVALEDLAALGVPMGLPEDVFRRAVRASWGATPLVRDLRAFCQTPRRFGEVRRRIRERAAVPNETTAAQTVIRWLLEFLPEEFSTRVFNYSEILVHKEGGTENKPSSRVP
jgi:hypothetical protein